MVKPLWYFPSSCNTNRYFPHLEPDSSYGSGFPPIGHVKVKQQLHNGKTDQGMFSKCLQNTPGRMFHMDNQLNSFQNHNLQG